MTSKPYVASGRYIERMSSGACCARCRYRPDRRSGDGACPFTTLYWDFLQRHSTRFAHHPRLGAQIRNLGRIDERERAAIREQAAALRGRLRAGSPVAAAPTSENA